MKPYFVLKSFDGVLGSYVAGTTADFGESTAFLLRNSHVICPLDSDEHAAFLAAATEVKPELVAILETKPEARTVLETKSARAKKGQ